MKIGDLFRWPAAKDVHWTRRAPALSGRDKATLVVFCHWTSLESVRHVERAEQLAKRYASHGLRVVLVHVPHERFESQEVLAKAMWRQQEVATPLLLDMKRRVHGGAGLLWDEACLVLNAESRVAYVGRHVNRQAEEAVVRQLKDAGAKRLPTVLLDRDVEGVSSTPTLMVGYQEGRFANASIHAGHWHAYRAAKPRADHPMIQGLWRVRAEWAESRLGQVSVPFRAAEVWVCMGSSDGKTHEVDVWLNGRTLERKQAGDDVHLQKTAGVVRVCEPRLYQLVASASVLDRVLTLRVPSNVYLYNIQCAN